MESEALLKRPRVRSKPPKCEASPKRLQLLILKQISEITHWALRFDRRLRMDETLIRLVGGYHKFPNCAKDSEDVCEERCNSSSDYRFRIGILVENDP